ncbi:MAG: CrcB family protein [Nocardioidaceae bacterium]|nr:CrcB family protein [Nocardioidaceae bacterium]
MTAPPDAARRPWFPRPSLVLLVALGGAAGTAARYGLGELVPSSHGWPWPTLLVNVTGSFALGLLLGLIARRGPETPAVERVRLGAGTGFLGGYTTYSSFAVQADQLLAGGRPGTAAATVLVSLAVGLVAAAAGVVLADRPARGSTP